MKNLLHEFKTFAMRGNVIDLAVAVVIGTAFGKIVSSLVDNIVTPLVGAILGGIDLSGLAVHFGTAAVTYGVFLQSVIDFVIIAFVIFLAVKLLGVVKRRYEADPKTPPLAPEVALLTEIRDELRARRR